MLTLHRLSAGYRVLYTGVLLFMTAGTAAHTAHQAARTGLSPRAIAEWYRGNEGDAAATVLLFPRGFEEVLGDAWLALTTYALALLIFGAVMARSGVARRLGTGLLLAYVAGAVVLSASPFLVAFAGAGWAAPTSGALLAQPALAAGLSTLAMWEMWARRERGPRFDPERVVGRAAARVAGPAGARLQ
ncbi:MAG: hypothetical protein ABFS34_14890 [Gemmatimonadota bacterium]